MSKKKSIKSHIDKDHVEKQVSAELFEYQAAQNFALHADAIAWQISTILISAVLVAFGFIIGRSPQGNDYIFGIILLINIVLSIWILIFLGQNQVRLMKLYRVREIEKKYDLKQNYYWSLDRKGTKQGRYRTYGFGGVFLTKILFSVLVVAPVIYGMFELFSPENSKYTNCVNPILLILSILIPTIALINGCCQESKFKEYLENEKP